MTPVMSNANAVATLCDSCSGADENVRQEEFVLLATVVAIRSCREMLLVYRSVKEQKPLEQDLKLYGQMLGADSGRGFQVRKPHTTALRPSEKRAALLGDGKLCSRVARTVPPYRVAQWDT